MLEKKIEDVDFFKSKKSAESRRLKKFAKFSFLFLSMQFVFLALNIEKSQIFLKEQEQKSTSIYHNYSQLQKATREGDQRQIIAQFSSLHHTDSIISNLLASGFVQSYALEASKVDSNIPEKFKEEYENSRPKITAETAQTIRYMYKNNPRHGLIAEKVSVDNMSCYLLDISCYVARPFIKQLLNDNIQKIEKKINVNDYNINHPEEFKKWQNNLLEAYKKGTPNNLIGSNPGEVYVYK